MVSILPVLSSSPINYIHSYHGDLCHSPKVLKIFVTVFELKPKLVGMVWKASPDVVLSKSLLSFLMISLPPFLLPSHGGIPTELQLHDTFAFARICHCFLFLLKYILLFLSNLYTPKLKFGWGSNSWPQRSGVTCSSNWASQAPLTLLSYINYLYLFIAAALASNLLIHSFFSSLVRGQLLQRAFTDFPNPELDVSMCSIATEQPALITSKTYHIPVWLLDSLFSPMYSPSSHQLDHEKFKS